MQPTGLHVFLVRELAADRLRPYAGPSLADSLRSIYRRLRRRDA